MQTVTKHEALAVRRSRERQLGPPQRLPDGSGDRLALALELIPRRAPGPPSASSAAKRSPAAARRSKTLKPAELKALTLLAEGYSYAEIGEMTGSQDQSQSAAWPRAASASGPSCPAQRERRPLRRAAAGPLRLLRRRGERRGVCRRPARAPARLRPLSGRDARLPGRAGGRRGPRLRCRSPLGRSSNAPTRRWPGCRRGSRGGSAAGLPTPPSLRSPRPAAPAGWGRPALAKLLAICAGTAGGAAVCVSAGVIPAPLDLVPDHPVRARRAAQRPLDRPTPAASWKPAPAARARTGRGNTTEPPVERTRNPKRSSVEVPTPKVRRRTPAEPPAQQPLAPTGPALVGRRGRGVRPRERGSPVQDDPRRAPGRWPRASCCPARRPWPPRPRRVETPRHRRRRLARGQRTSAPPGRTRFATRPIAAVHYLVRDPLGQVVRGPEEHPRPLESIDRIPCRQSRRRVHRRSLARGRRWKPGPGSSGKAAIRRCAADGCGPPADLRLGRAKRHSLRGSPQPPRRPAAGLRHPRLRRLGRPGAATPTPAPREIDARTPRRTCVAG